MPATALRPGALLPAAMDGDAEAWSRLVDRHTALLWSVCRSFRLGRGVAQDVVQTVWLRLLERGHTIRDPDAVTSWLVTTTRRECLAMVRDGRRCGPAELLPEPADVRLPQDEILRADRDRLLWRAVRRLPERDARLLLLLARGVSYGEVAAVLRIPVGSVGPTKMRALRKVRAELAGAGIHNLAEAL